MNGSGQRATSSHSPHPTMKMNIHYLRTIFGALRIAQILLSCLVLGFSAVYCPGVNPASRRPTLAVDQPEEPPDPGCFSVFHFPSELYGLDESLSGYQKQAATFLSIATAFTFFISCFYFLRHLLGKQTTLATEPWHAVASTLVLGLATGAVAFVTYSSNDPGRWNGRNLSLHDQGQVASLSGSILWAVYVADAVVLFYAKKVKSRDWVQGRRVSRKNVSFTLYPSAPTLLTAVH